MNTIKSSFVWIAGLILVSITLVGFIKLVNWSGKESRRHFDETYLTINDGIGYCVERKDGGIADLKGWRVHSNCPSVLGDLNLLVITNSGRVAQVFTGKPIEPGTKVLIKGITHKVVSTAVGEISFLTAEVAK